VVHFIMVHYVHDAGKEWSSFQGARGRKEAEWWAGGCFPSHSVYQLLPFCS
jgi:hypothetical protein